MLPEYKSRGGGENSLAVRSYKATVQGEGSKKKPGGVVLWQTEFLS
jgi:hypothetical protein